MMTTGGNDPRSNVQTIYGLYTDTKPTDGIGNGWAFVEMDTGKLYFYDAEGAQWIEWGGSTPSGSAIVGTAVVGTAIVN